MKMNPFEMGIANYYCFLPGKICKKAKYRENWSMSKNSNVFQIKYREKFALMYRTRVRTLCLNWIVSFIYGLVRSGIFLRSLLTNVNWIKEFLAGVCSIYAIHSRNIFSNSSLFGATIFQIYEVKSATMFQGWLY